MRTIYALSAAAALGIAAAGLGAEPAAAVCSAFHRHPCAPTSCSVFRHRPCIPYYPYYELWIGQDLRLTITSADLGAAEPRAGEDSERSEHKLKSIRDMFAALRECWIPPTEDQARSGMQMSVRFAFKRNGEIIAPPRVTYANPNAPPEVRDTYHNAIIAALERCTPLPLSAGLGGAIAGHPIAIRFVDDRTLQEQHR
jgi:hypothetical protein